MSSGAISFTNRDQNLAEEKYIYIFREEKKEAVLGFFGEIDGSISSLMSPLRQSLQFSTFQSLSL